MYIVAKILRNSSSEVIRPVELDNVDVTNTQMRGPGQIWYGG